MLITEALQEIKLCVKKIDTQREFVIRNFRIDENAKDPFEKKGSTQAKEVASAIQSINDLTKRIVALRSAINKKNMETTLVVEGVTHTVSEWLIWKREVMPILLNVHRTMASMFSQSKTEQEVSVRTRTGETMKIVYIINYSEMDFIQSSNQLNSLIERLDAQLSIIDATTSVDGF